MIDAPTFASIATGIGVTVAIAFGVAQMRQSARHRQDQALVEMARMFIDPEMGESFRTVRALPDSLGWEDLQKLPAEQRHAVLRILTTVEATGMLVHRRVIPLDGVLVDAVYYSTKLRRVIDEGRAQANPHFLEFLDYLAQAQRSHLAKHRNPAYAVVR